MEYYFKVPFSELNPCVEKAMNESTKSFYFALIVCLKKTDNILAYMIEQYLKTEYQVYPQLATCKPLAKI